MRPVSRLAMTVALVCLLVAAGGCRAWRSYVPLTPPSAAWTHDPDDLPEEYVWRADGVTVRVHSAGSWGGRGSSGNSTKTPRDVTLTFVVTNDGPGPLAVTVECGGADPGATYQGVWTSPSEATIPLFPERHSIDFVGEAFELPARAAGDGTSFQEFEVDYNVPKEAPPATERHLLFDLYLRRGETEIHCPAHFVAHGSARDLHWYTIPADVAVWTVELCAMFVLLPLTFNGAG